MYVISIPRVAWIDTTEIFELQRQYVDERLFFERQLRRHVAFEDAGASQHHMNRTEISIAGTFFDVDLRRRISIQRADLDIDAHRRRLSADLRGTDIVKL